MNKLHLKKFYCLLIVMLVSVSAVFAQGYNTVTWKFSNPRQFGFNIADVDYYDNNNVLAVGSDGGIAKSTDGGRNWTYGVFTYINQTGFQVKPTFNDVHFITATTAYAVGNSGVMIKTTDGGITWNVVTTPLWANTKNINTCWFLDANKGYIGGEQNNTVDSLPKVYFTLNGGSTWDSIAAPASNGVTRCGYINNVNIPSVLLPVDAKMKTIYHIEFINNNIGYISGSASPLFPRVSSNAVAATCLPSTGNLTTSAHTAGLLWKFENGVLTDYSVSKERLGYFGINTNTITCTTSFANIVPASQTYKAMNIINDSTVVILSFNNNIVIKIHTGVNDSTANVNAPGIYEKGRYEMLNYPNPPTQGPNAGPAIPPVQVLIISNPLQIKAAPNGKLYTAGAKSTFFNTPGKMYTSVDTGRNWIEEIPFPQTPGIIAAAPGAQAIDFAPNGRLLVSGTDGAVADSLPGGTWFTNWSTVPVSASYSDMEFVDCDNGIAAGGSSITVTTDGGNTWIDRASLVLQALNAQINSVNYVSLNKAYFTTSIGNLYRTANQGATLNPVFAEPYARLTDLATIGTDSLWMAGVYINSPLPSANRQAAIFRSFDNGANWDTVRVGPMGSATYLQFNKIEMATRLVGYAAGNRNSIWKTVDGGATWTDISPVPVLNVNMNYTGLQALNKDTVFACGNGFPAKVIYRTTDGGATWVDITNNLTLLGGGNINGVLMHDVNNGYACSPGGYLFVTNNGGASWTLDIAPTANLFTAMAFVPKTVGPGVSMVNRKMFVSGPNVSGAPMMEYGNPANTTVNSSEAIANVTCSNPNSGSITITATGGVAPYTYSLNGGPYQASNVFSGLAAGNYTISIKDAYCGLLTKPVTISQTDDQVINVNPTSATVCAGVPVQLTASGNSTSYSWSPTTGLSNPNIANPVATVNTTTTYTVTGTLNSCTKTATVTINVNPNLPLLIQAVPGTTLCQGDPAALTVYETAGSSPVSITHSSSNTITAGNSVACNAGTTGQVNSYWRAYNLNNFPAVTGSYTITSATFGIEAMPGAVAALPITVNLYDQTGAAFPGGTRTLIRSQVFNIAPQTGTLYTATFTTPVTVPNTSTVVVEVSNQTVVTGVRFFIGSNAAAETDVSYLSSAACGITAPTPVAAIGFPNMHIILGLNGTVPGIGGIATGTFLWSPAAGLSSTTTNPVAASPAVTTTYTVVRTTPAGCVGTANITLTVNQRPVVTSQPASRTNCVGTTATFTVTGTGTGVTYQWQESTNGGVSYTNLNNVPPYSGVTTPTLTITGVTLAMNNNRYRCVLSGTCPPGVPPLNVSNGAILTVNALPTVTVTPTTGCGGVAGINGLLLTASGASTYTWAPTTGLYTNANATTPYTGGNAASVYAAPTSFTIYTVTGTAAGTGCSNTASAQINYTPPAPTVTPSSVTMCLGDPAVRLTSASSSSTSVQFCSGPISVAVPDNTTTGASHSINVSGVPASCNVSAMSVTFNMTHTWDGDMVIVLKGPNGNILNLDYYLSSTGGTGATTGFVNTNISSTGTAALSSGSGTYTGTFKADALITGPFGPTGPDGFLPTVSNWNGLYSVPNGTYTLAMYDGGGGDLGVLTSWCLNMTYVCGVPSTAATWSPIAGLYTDPAATIAYTGTPRDTVYTRPTPSGVYNYQATVQSLSLPPSEIQTTFTNNNQFALVTSNFTNNNAFPVTITGIESIASTSGGSTARLYYKTSAINGAPGAINAANGWVLAGTGTYTAVANTTTTVPQPMLSGLTLTIPAGATYGIAFESQITGGAGNLRYSTVTAGTYTNTGGGCVLTSGTNVSYAGDLAPIAPTFTPRAFIGKILFSGANAAACTSPARTVVVTVNQPTTLNANLPANQTVCTDKVATFSAAVTAGTGPYSYQWQVSTNGGNTWTNISNSGIYSGATSATLTVSGPSVTLSGNLYRCVVTGAAPCAAQTSKTATLTVNPLPTVVISASPYLSLLPGMTTTITSSVTPNAAATYNWQRNGVTVPGNTGTLNVNVDGMGTYRLTVTDVNGCTNSSNTITIKDSVSAKCFIYPNPNSGMFQVRYYSVANNVLPRSLTVYDAQGNRVMTQFYTVGRPYDRMDVDLRRNGKGLYWVEIGDLNGNRLTMCRVVIQ